MLLGSQGGTKCAINRLNTFSYGFRGGSTARSQGEVNATAVVRNVRAFEITTFDECVHELARRLFGHAELANKVRS